MAIAINARTGKVTNVPDHYIGHKILGKDLELVGAEPVRTKAQDAPKAKKRQAEYVLNPVDADGDGFVQDGTIWERPLGELLPEEQPAPENQNENHKE